MPSSIKVDGPAPEALQPPSSEVVERVHRATERRIEVPYDDGEVVASDYTPDMYAEQAELIVALERERSRLSTIEAAVLSMRFDEELTFAEIAERLAMTIGKVQQAQRRGLQTLRKKLAID